MGLVTWISFRKEVENYVHDARDRALEIIGGKAETYAKQICPVDTGRLRNNITHQQYNKDTEIIGNWF